MKIKSAILKVIGWSCVIFGVVLLIVGIGMTIDTDPAQSSDGPSIALSSLVFFTPAAISLYMARRISREHDLISTLSLLVNSYGRITVAELSSKLSIPQSRIVHGLSRAVESGTISGIFDRTTDEFVASNTESNPSKIINCPRCGAALEAIYLKKDTIKCRQCGSIIA